MSIEYIKEIIALFPPNAPAFFAIVIFFAIFIWLMYATDKSGYLDWSEVITTSAQDRISLSKCLQLIGGMTATWIMIFMTLHEKLTWDLFTTYLAYVGAVEGYSKYLMAKHGSKEKS